MEPVKGGTLANPPESVRTILKNAEPDMSVASWAIRFAASQEGIITVLSGMSTLEQVEDNLSYMKDFKPLDEEEQKVIEKVQKIFEEQDTIKCTACHYCTGGCPMSIPIPNIFSISNDYKLYGDFDGNKHDYDWRTTMEDNSPASACIECGQCEAACPQQLPIIALLKECAKTFED